MTNNPDSRCPACGAANQCAVAAGQPVQQCWCMQVDVAAGVLAALPDGERGRRCLCPHCLAQDDKE